ncbi:39S ribosomal protein L52, mitochondrial [Trichoplax sp. H2]|nr:39S ribosomal protein L52, mitochondrial [Trichoplax sp. H2]|eukprot:RDD44097.1 39S ribosomal protein L52, mitochondrial [Trichoplax sp. H2]
MQTVRISLPVLQRFRMLSTTSCHSAGEKWRIRRNLPRSGNEYGPLTELPDWSYADGRPGPISKGQKKRDSKQQALSERVQRLLNEVDTAKEES